MPVDTAAPVKRSVETLSGRISYSEAGSGPVALFVHGMLMNGHFWRHQLAGLSAVRRCIAVDLLAHGDTEIVPAQRVSPAANAGMLEEFLDALVIRDVDLVGNGCGSGIAQIFAALHPSRVRSLALTNGDVHDGGPPDIFGPFRQMAASGGLREALEFMLADKAVYRSEGALGLAYEHADQISDKTIETYLRPLMRNGQRVRDLQRFITAIDDGGPAAIELRLRRLSVPTLIAWGTDDVHFDIHWARWLADAIPGTRRHVELEGARACFPEERSEEFNHELCAHWNAACRWIDDEAAA
jgi:pimeloyl-ACP methyl ester carboxylesterase